VQNGAAVWINIFGKCVRSTAVSTTQQELVL